MSTQEEQAIETSCVHIHLETARANHQEVELLPSLAKIGTRNFPGLIQSIFVVNAGWTQRSLWKIVKPVLPRHSIERIKFIDKPDQLAEYFHIERLPTGTSMRHVSLYHLIRRC